jgi:hypothetical protein
MTPGEALLTVQAALEAWKLPGGVGLREADRTFIVQLAPGDVRARPAVAGLLTAMGCEIVVNGHRDVVYGKLSGLLHPAPPLPPAHVGGADSAHAAELAALTTLKRCADYLLVKDLEDFIFLSRKTGRRCSYCVPCEKRRQSGVRARKAARMASRLADGFLRRHLGKLLKSADRFCLVLNDAAKPPSFVRIVGVPTKDAVQRRTDPAPG